MSKEEKELPKDADELWGWLNRPKIRKTLLDILAVCAGHTVDTVEHGGIEASMQHAGELAAALKLDMAEYWQPTAAGLSGGCRSSSARRRGRSRRAGREGFALGAQEGRPSSRLPRRSCKAPADSPFDSPRGLIVAAGLAPASTAGWRNNRLAGSGNGSHRRAVPAH